MECWHSLLLLLLREGVQDKTSLKAFVLQQAGTPETRHQAHLITLSGASSGGI